MIKIEYIKDKRDQSDEDIQQTIDAINDFFFNPNDILAFGKTMGSAIYERSVKNEQRILKYDYDTFYTQYLKIDFLLTQSKNCLWEDIHDDIYELVKNTSIFLPVSLMDKIYSEFDTLIDRFSDKEKEILIDYKNTPRLFYISSNNNNATKNNLADEFWEYYFTEVITTQEFQELMSYNKTKYTTALKQEIICYNDMPWLLDFENKTYDFPLAQHIAKVFNLSDSDIKMINAVLAETKLYSASQIIMNTKSFFPSRFQSLSLFSGLKQVMPYVYGISKKDLEIFLSNKIFRQNNIFKSEINIVKGEYTSIYEIGGEHSFLKLNDDIDFDSVVEKYLPFINNTCTLTLQDYSHIQKEVDSLIKVVQQDEPKDILVWGPPGFGKTQLVKCINKHLGLNIVEVSKDKIDAEARFNMINNAKNVRNLIGNFCVLIDEAEDILKGKESKSILTRELDNKKVHTFWIINNLEEIPEAFLRRFDYILEISEMPFDLRKTLAENELSGKGDDSLAYKIAQAIHTPAEIKSAVQWCHITNDYSWANISSKIIAYQKALAKSIKNEIGNFSIEVIAPEQNTSLDNFAGYAYIKDEAKDILDIFAHPEKYSKVGAKVPKGVLLSGEPGVGKTMFTKCLASELSTTLITADSSALAKQPERIKMLFEKAKSQAPCIVFIDEIDVLASSVLDAQGNIDTEKQKILNQLLIELDGFHSFSGVMVIGATHRADLLDEAVTRSGRLGKTIYFRSPSMQDRQEIIAHYCNTIKTDNNINYHQLAKLSAAFTSADIAMAVNEAALLAARRGREYVKNSDLVESINQVFFGASLNGMPMTTKQKWRTAIHEAGHALVATKIGQTPQRVTIKPHLNFLGVVNLEENEGNYGASWTQVKQKLQVFLAGLVAEEIIFSEHSQGVESDLNMINRFVNDAITKSGMSQSLGGMTVGIFDKVSYKLMEQMEAERKQIIDEAKSIVTEWLTEHKKELVDFAKLLYEQRSLDQDTMKDWFTANILKKDVVDENTDIESLIEAAYNA